MFENESKKQVELSDQMWANREKMIRNLPESSLARILGETSKAAIAQMATNGDDQLVGEATNAEFEENLRKVMFFF